MTKVILIVMIGGFVQTEAVGTFDTTAQCYQHIEWILRNDPPIYPDTKFACVRANMLPKGKTV